MRPRRCYVSRARLGDEIMQALQGRRLTIRDLGHELLGDGEASAQGVIWNAVRTLRAHGRVALRQLEDERVVVVLLERPPAWLPLRWDEEDEEDEWPVRQRIVPASDAGGPPLVGCVVRSVFEIA